MMHKLLIIVFTCFLVNCQIYYQERVLYYNSHDYACDATRTLDYINLVINFNDSVIIQIDEIGGVTGCDKSQYLPSRIIHPTKSWYHLTMDGGTKIYFDQQTTYVGYGMLILQIIQKSTVRNPVLYEHQNYNCLVIGDGKQQHYGTHFDQYPPAQVQLKCSIYEPQTQ